MYSRMSLQRTFPVENRSTIVTFVTPLISISMDEVMHLQMILLFERHLARRTLETSLICMRQMMLVPQLFRIETFIAILTEVRFVPMFQLVRIQILILRKPRAADITAERFFVDVQSGVTGKRVFPVERLRTCAALEPMRCV
uniref:Uncharacterized protein n=1 Tax=Cacopsylla melanoneura TaxID=428564 RepID=A0A8D9EXP2_9HEMI